VPLTASAFGEKAAEKAPLTMRPVHDDDAFAAGGFGAKGGW
jgi:hypothetical protein